MGDWYFTYICLSVEKLQPTQRGSRLIIIARRFSCGTHDTCVMVFLSAVSQETLNKVLLTAILLRAALSAALLVCLYAVNRPIYPFNGICSSIFPFCNCLRIYFTRFSCGMRDTCVMVFYHMIASLLYPHNNPLHKNGHFHTDILHLFSCL